MAPGSDSDQRGSAEDQNFNNIPSKPRKVLGMELAPLNIPLHRRLETIAISHFVFCFMALGLLCLQVTIILLFTRLYWVTLISYAWVIYDRQTPSRGGRRSNWMQRWAIWKHMAKFFPARLHKTADLDPSKNYLLAYHPHGIMSIGAFVNFSTEGTGFSELFPGITSYLLMLKLVFSFPLVREYFLSAGLCDVSSESLDWVLGKNGRGNAAVVVVGGAKESLESNPVTHRLYLSKRKGFVRKAIQHGASLVPVYSFGESSVYDQIPNPEGSTLRKMQIVFTNIVGVAPPMFKGRGFFNYSVGLLPHRKPINTVVGRPIPVKKNSNPTKEEIDEYHRLYIESLCQTFEENKTKFGIDESRQLEII